MSSTPVLQKVVMKLRAASPLRHHSPSSMSPRSPHVVFSYSPQRANKTASPRTLCPPGEARATPIARANSFLHRRGRALSKLHLLHATDNFFKRLTHSTRSKSTANVQNTPPEVNHDESRDSAISPGSTLLSQRCEDIISSPAQAQRYRLQRRILYANKKSNTAPDLPTPPSNTNIPATCVNSPSDDSKSDSECMIDDADDALQFIAPIEQIGEMELCDLVSQLQIPDTPIVAWRHAHSGTGGNEKRQTASDGTKRVLSIIGKGGFGSVFIAHYNGRKVAIKQLYNRKTEGGTTKIKESSFLAELNAFGLSHPNVVKILTFTCLSNVTQVVYEYVGHRTLAHVILSNDNNMEPLPIQRRMRILTQVIDALNYCHTQRIVHLDVKPHNVLLTDLPNEICKLADFGCSRRLQLNDSEVVVDSNRCGTLVYTAPEILQHSVATARADIYSFALTTWQLLSRQQIHCGMHAHQVVFLVVMRQLRPSTVDLLTRLTEHERHAHFAYSHLIALVERAWSADIVQRPRARSIADQFRDITAKLNLL